MLFTDSRTDGAEAEGAWGEIYGLPGLLPCVRCISSSPYPNPWAANLKVGG